MNTIKNDDLSFIKFIDKEKRKYEKYKELIELKIKQSGGSMINITTLQEQLLKIKVKLDMINKSRKDEIIEPYSKLKHLIDNINNKINKLDTDLNGIVELTDIESKLLVNRINDIDILIDKTAADYKGVYANSTVQFVKEKIDPEKIDQFVKYYIDNTESLVNDLRTKIGGGANLVENEDIKKNIDDIDEKIKTYDEKMVYIIGGVDSNGKKHEGILTQIKTYITQMESLYKGNESEDYKLIDTDIDNYTDGKKNYFSDGGKLFLKNPNPKSKSDIQEPAKDKVIVKPESSDTSNEFQYYKESVDEIQSEDEETEAQSRDLLKTDFIELVGGNSNKIEPEIFTIEIKKKEINPLMVKLYKTWKEKINLIRNEDMAIIKYQKVKSELLDKKSKIEKLVFSTSTINDFLPEDLQKKLSDLYKVNIIIEEIINNCNTVISGFKETKQINTLINCKNDDSSFTKEYESALIKEINDTLLEKKNEFEKQLEEIDIKIQDPKFIELLKHNPKEKQKRQELKELLGDFILKVNTITKDLKIRDEFSKIIKNKYFTTFDNKKINYVKALIKINDHPVGLTEQSLHKIIVSINKDNYFDIFIKKVESIEREIERFSKLSDDEILIKINKAKDETKSKLVLINDYLKLPKQSGGAKKELSEMHMNTFILKLSEFEMKIREMKIKRNEIKKLTRKYNIRYTQFFNFQKYIVNYVSLILAQEEYTYWQLMSKGSISFYENILKRLEETVDKFEDPSLFKVRETFMTKENIWFYSKHFFFIKILKQFFSELYKFWELNDDNFKEENRYKNPSDTDLSNFNKIVEDKVKNQEEGYINLSSDKQRLKAVRLFKRSITDKNPWSLTNKMDTLANVMSNSPNKNYFFLFNIFFRILDVYQMKLPPVANYMRINFNQDVPATKEVVFEKNPSNKHYMKEEQILKCFNVNLKPGEKPDPEAAEKARAIKNIYFEEVFDPDNFAENDALSMYMGLGNMLSEGKSVMLLTYGYSGVGKTFTLFGTKGVEGMLQSTLNGITGASKIEMKAFELYGLGVPYKFYWEANKFTHSIYKYELDNLENTTIKPKPLKFEDTYEPYKKYKERLLKEGKQTDSTNSFNSVLNQNNHYTPITGYHISNFEQIVTNIDNIRRENGRIKTTINNPESSRSIMIYDFKIEVSIKGQLLYPRLVVMDLPGKENLYQTYCDRTSINDMYEPRARFVNHRKGPQPDTDMEANDVEPEIFGNQIKEEDDEARSQQSDNDEARSVLSQSQSVRSARTTFLQPQPARSARTTVSQQPPSYLRGKQKGGATYTNPHYNEKMIKAMMYINPLWLGMIPEIAEHFDDGQRDGEHLISSGQTINIPTLTSYALDVKTDKNTFENITKYQNNRPNLKLPGQVIKNGSNASHFSIAIYPEDDKRALYGLTSRALANITNIIKKPLGLEVLGEKINNMLIQPDAKKKRYGYAGLEGVYINENILGLLQVLGKKIQLTRPGKTEQNIVDVVCPQNEIYKNLLNGNDIGLTPISWDLLREDGFIDETDNFIKNAPILVQENEFISQIQLLRSVIRSSTTLFKMTYFNPNAYDKYINYFRNNKSLDIKKNNTINSLGLSDNLDNIEKNWINNYDYNKIFNKENPPIKSILAPYLDDPLFQNFYLFFVTSNNVKEAPDGNNIDTCGKQIQLMYDTRHFMEVISKSDPTGAGQCTL